MGGTAAAGLESIPNAVASPWRFTVARPPLSNLAHNVPVCRCCLSGRSLPVRTCRRRRCCTRRPWRSSQRTPHCTGVDVLNGARAVMGNISVSLTGLREISPSCSSRTRSSSAETTSSFVVYMGRIPRVCVVIGDAAPGYFCGI